MEKTAAIMENWKNAYISSLKNNRDLIFVSNIWFSGSMNAMVIKLTDWPLSGEKWQPLLKIGKMDISPVVVMIET